MESFFNSFPRRVYDLNADGNYQLVTDVFKRIKIRDVLKDKSSLYATYSVKSGDTPETIAFKYYGSTDYYWVVLLMNDITDAYYDWPLSDQAFEEYVNDKYANPGATRHYEKVQSSGTTTGNGPGDYDHMIECLSTDAGAQSVSYYEYEQRLQDNKRQIKLLNNKYLSIVVNEFEKLMSE